MTNAPTLTLEQIEEIEAGGWQPIETARKDGTHFLAYEPTGDMYRAAYHRDGYLCAYGGQPVVETPDPTHWMPLPAPPGEGASATILTLCALAKEGLAAREAEPATLDANELWEALFGIMKGAVPEQLTDSVLERLASHINTAFLASPPAPPVSDAMVDGVIAEIAGERRRQIAVEGWSAEHDDAHVSEELARAAACYARPGDISWTDNFGRSLDENGERRPMSAREAGRKWSYALALRWPWSREWWKPKDRRRNLIRAAALLVAEIERLDRAEDGGS